MKIPELEFNIPKMNFSHLQEQISHYESRLKKIIKKTGKNSKAFKNIREKLVGHIKRRERHLEQYISNSLAIRALTDLWLNESFNVRCPVTEPLMDSIFSVKKYPGTISLLQLVRLFFQRFEKCGDLNALIDGIRNTFELSGKKKFSNDLSAVAIHYKSLISRDGPNWVVEQAIEKKVDLDTLQHQMGLSYYFSGRFGDICKYLYYLSKLKDLSPNQSSPLFSEIKKQKVYQAPFKEGRLLGHEILSILIDKAPESELSKEWQDIILGIAGDPRVPKNSPKYQKWWALLGSDQIQKVNTWLSGFDLLLFLEILENFGLSSGNEDLQRMFPARKRFLEGLHKKKMIHGSRLFVSTNADRYLHEYYKKSELPQLAICQGSTSVIYLNIQGHHMIEGSHNFSLRIYDTLPENSQILDYGVETFSQRDLGNGLSDAYEAEKNGFSIQKEMGKFSWEPKSNTKNHILKVIKSQGSYKTAIAFYKDDSIICKYARKVAFNFYNIDKTTANKPKHYKDGFPIIIRHTPTKQNWQHRTISTFKTLNIKIDPESVFSKEDYQEYKQRYGLTY